MLTTNSTTTKELSYLSLPKIENYAESFHRVQKSQIQKTTSVRHVRNKSQFAQSDQWFCLQSTTGAHYSLRVEPVFLQHVSQLSKLPNCHQSPAMDRKRLAEFLFVSFFQRIFFNWNQHFFREENKGIHRSSVRTRGENSHLIQVQWYDNYCLPKKYCSCSGLAQ